MMNTDNGVEGSDTYRDICVSSIRTVFSVLRMIEAGSPSSLIGVH